MGGGNERICVGNRLSDGRTAAMQFALRPKMNLLALLLLAFSCHGTEDVASLEISLWFFYYYLLQSFSKKISFCK